MKRTLETMRMTALALLALPLMGSLTSCNDDDDEYYYFNGSYNAIVTLKTNPQNGVFYMQLDDSTTIFPSNIKTAPYGGKEVRALVNFVYEDSLKGHASHSVFINRLDTVRTKPMSADLGADNAKTYGNDPLKIIRDWTTVCEDGYLTLRFRTYFSGERVHALHLVSTAKDTVEVFHDANGDMGGVPGDGIIAFRLSVPDAKQGSPMVLKWKSFRGVKTVKFKYSERK